VLISHVHVHFNDGSGGNLDVLILTMTVTRQESQIKCNVLLFIKVCPSQNTVETISSLF